ncbi:MAG: phage shock protein A [Acidobacteria bacterium]|nr:MAG: phage shock protein A [Acidobacteriota bacterium]
MALLERVSALIRANLNDLIDRAEDPQKMLKQVILDMQNQMLQVKTQVAIAAADEHLLRKKQKENEDKHAEWMRKAELAVDKKQDDLARAAIERGMGYKNLAHDFGEEIEHQKTQVDNLRSAMRKLEQKLTEAQAKSELLIAKHRRSRALTKASQARMAAHDESKMGTFDRMKNKVHSEEAMGQAMAEMANDNVDEKLDSLDRNDEIERLLADLKARRGVA